MGSKEVVLFTDNDIELEVPVSPDQDTVWLSLEQMAVLFEKDRSVIGRHVRNIFKEGELDEESSGQKCPEVWKKIIDLQSSSILMLLFPLGTE